MDGFGSLLTIQATQIDSLILYIRAELRPSPAFAISLTDDILYFAFILGLSRAVGLEGEYLCPTQIIKRKVQNQRSRLHLGGGVVLFTRDKARIR